MKRWEAKPPTFLDGSKASRGRPDPQKDRFSVKSLNPNPLNPNPSAADVWPEQDQGLWLAPRLADAPVAAEEIEVLYAEIEEFTATAEELTT